MVGAEDRADCRFGPLPTHDRSCACLKSTAQQTRGSRSIACRQRPESDGRRCCSPCDAAVRSARCAPTLVRKGTTLALVDDVDASGAAQRRRDQNCPAVRNDDRRRSDSALRARSSRWPPTGLRANCQWWPGGGGLTLNGDECERRCTGSEARRCGTDHGGRWVVAGSPDPSASLWRC